MNSALLLLVLALALSPCLVSSQWPGPPYPKTVGIGSDNCTASPCPGFISMPPKSERIPPLYPKTFTNHVSGVLVIPFTIQSLSEPHVYLAQESTFYFDHPTDHLKFDNNLKFGFANFTNNFIHTGDRMYAKQFGVCFCTNIGIGILNWDAFADAEYLGRETKFVEYLWKNFTVDHYLKGPHHVWWDVQTGLPIRAWQPTNGLQVYQNWTLSVDPKVFDLPKLCIKVNCTDSTPRVSSSSSSSSSSVLLLNEDKSEGRKEEKELSPSSCPHMHVSDKDVDRARNPIPRPEYRAKEFAQMSSVLNKHMVNNRRRTVPCSSFSTESLDELALVLRAAALPEFQELYKAKGDPRMFKHDEKDELEKGWKQERGLLGKYPHLRNMTRDGKCHEVVMWFTHHLTEQTQEALRNFIVLPELPTFRHDVASHVEQARVDDDESNLLHSAYKSRLACTACHKM